MSYEGTNDGSFITNSTLKRAVLIDISVPDVDLARIRTEADLDRFIATHPDKCQIIWPERTT